MSSFLERYRAGERVAVWDEIRALGGAVRTPEYYQDVVAVADETMDRVRSNVDSLVARLRESGYEFVWPGGGDYHTDRSRCLPDRDTPKLIEFLEQISGPIPLTLRSWMLRVGDVNSEYDDWQAWVKEDGLEAVGPFRLPFAPDVYHKVNVSGGRPYSILLPEAGADAVIDIYEQQIYFVDYLRECFQWGGFPGFGTLEKGRDNGTIAALTDGLLDI